MIEDIFIQEIAEETKSSTSLESGIVIVDVSDSMLFPYGEYSRLQIAALTVKEIKSRADVQIWATAGSDAEMKHKTEKMPDHFFGKEIWLSLKAANNTMGGGGIFIDQAIEYISHYSVKPKCLYILTDDQASFSEIKWYKEKLHVLDMSKLLPDQAIRRLEC